MGSETRCEACQGTDRVQSLRMATDIGIANLCHSCRCERGCGKVDDEIRSRRRSRSQSAGELEALEFVAARDGRVEWVCPWLNNMPQYRHFRAGDRVKLYRVEQPSHTSWALRQNDLCGLLVGDDSVARIHAELIALRDSAPSPQPEGRQPAMTKRAVFVLSSNPLRHLAEAFRSLAPHVCICGRPCVTVWSGQQLCVRCETGISQALPAPEQERRHPADWDVDPDAPDGCA